MGMIGNQLVVGMATPAQVSDLANSSTGAFDVPVGTTAQRPASPNSGYLRYNTDTSQLEIYNGSSWGNVTPAVTPANVSDQSNTSVGAFDLPSGTTAQRPSSPSVGMARFNTDTLSLEVYSSSGWFSVDGTDLSLATQINTTSMVHGASVSLQDHGSTNITNYGAAALSLTPGSGGFTGSFFGAHGGHNGSSDFPMYWGVYLGQKKAVNQLKAYIHANSFGYFRLEGSNNSGNGTGFQTNGTWTTIPFLSSSNANSNQNMAGNSSGYSDGTVFTYTYNNNVGYLAYRVVVLDSSKPNVAQGTTYMGSAAYQWQLNRA